MSRRAVAFQARGGAGCLAPCPRSPSALPRRVEFVALPGRFRRILHIEDPETDAHIVMRAFRERSEVTLTTAPTGSEGLAKAAQEPYDLILLDHALPDMTGVEVFLKLREELSATLARLYGQGGGVAAEGARRRGPRAPAGELATVHGEGPRDAARVAPRGARDVPRLEGRPAARRLPPRQRAGRGPFERDGDGERAARPRHGRREPPARRARERPRARPGGLLAYRRLADVGSLGVVFEREADARDDQREVDAAARGLETLARENE